MSYRSGYLIGAGRAELAGYETDDPAIVAAWRREVKAAGRIATAWPYKDAHYGDLASRAATGGDYQLAPLAVIAAMNLHRAGDYVLTDIALPLATTGEGVAVAAAGALKWLTVLAVGALALPVLFKRGR